MQRLAIAVCVTGILGAAAAWAVAVPMERTQAYAELSRAVDVPAELAGQLVIPPVALPLQGALTCAGALVVVGIVGLVVARRKPAGPWPVALLLLAGGASVVGAAHASTPPDAYTTVLAAIVMGGPAVISVGVVFAVVSLVSRRGSSGSG